MSLPAWWQVTKPHKDIREARLSEAIFAADLGDAILGKAPLEYQDPSIFFQKTYLTKGLGNLLENILSRLSGGKGDPVIQLQTPFGGGKTHALLALYHTVKYQKNTANFKGLEGLPQVKNAKVAAFVGTHADAISGKTPWGEIAEQLGFYKVIAEHDKKRIAPGKERLREVLEGAGPTLILMDEVLEYIVKANRAEKLEKITLGQTLAFLQELSEVIASSKDCCLVLTLPASILESYDEDAERALQQLQKVSGRVEAVYTPVEGIELYEVVRRRLFEDVGDEKTIKSVAQHHFDFYQKLGADVPSEVRDIDYRERIERAYPFHPELIDMLYERWGSYPTFQRTRGVLRLLAEIVGDMYKSKVYAPLIQSSTVNLDNQVIRREFVKHIGNEYDTIIAADVAGKTANAPKIDRDMGSEYEKYNIAGGIATAVFLYSFSGGGSKGTTLPRIRVSVLREGIPATIVGDAAAKLEEELWYFHSEGKEYAFRNQINLNRVIMQREEPISDERVLDALKERIQKNSGSALSTYIWPKGSQDVPDNKNLKLIVLSPDYSPETDKGREFASEFFEKAGVGFRVYKNTMFIVLMDNNQYTSLNKSLRRLLAILDIQGDASCVKTLTKQDFEELNKKVKDAEKEMPFKILNAYRHLATLQTDGPYWRDLGIPTLGSDKSLSERVKAFLRDEEKILPKLTPKYLLDKTFGKDENEKVLRDMYELHLKTPGMSLPESENVVIDAVADGVKAGILGLRKDGRVFHIEAVSPDTDSTVLREEYAKQLKTEQQETSGEKKKGDDAIIDVVRDKGPEIPKEEAVKGSITKVSFKATVPWDKISAIVSGVIKPLKDRGSEPAIKIEITASSGEGFDRMTLDSKVKETLKQIGATIEDWKEE